MTTQTPLDKPGSFNERATPTPRAPKKKKVKPKPDAPEHMSASSALSATHTETEAASDLLGREKLTQALHRLLTEREDDHPFAIGLFGHWGAGKSSQVNFLQDELKNTEKPQILVAEFNAWHNEKATNLAAMLAQAVVDGLVADKGIWEKLKLAVRLAALSHSHTRKILKRDWCSRLKAEIGSLKGLIGHSIKKAVKDINEFLDMAAIDYILEINHESESETKTILKYKKKGKDAVSVENIRMHLSWGERNAFALVLFLHRAATQNPDLIILDDPISSFDTNKKYAIMNRVFANDQNVKTLYKKTVLMLTHDFQPVIDFIINAKPHGGATEAAFLRNDSGTIVETAIGPSDIRSFTKQLSEAASNDQLNKVHRVTSLRKLVEHTARSREEELAYNILSCLLHLKPVPSYVDGTLIDPLDVAMAEAYVRTFIPDFSYAVYLADYFSQAELSKTYSAETNEYFKVQVFRILIEIHELRSKIDDPLLKYIDEQFHVENDYVFFLDYTKYNNRPFEGAD